MVFILSVNWGDTAIISGIIGVIGTILGTILGFLLNYLVNKGKFKIYLHNRDFKFSQDKKYTTLEKITCEFIFYNTTNEIKSIINPHFVCIIGKKEYKFNCFLKSTNDNLHMEKVNKPIEQFDIIPKSSVWTTFTIPDSSSINIVPRNKMSFYFCFLNSKNKEEIIDLNFYSSEYFNCLNVLIKK